jgi:hypothetical protein
MLAGYNRNATVQHSDFSYIGGNAIASWGASVPRLLHPPAPASWRSTHSFARSNT